MEDHKSVTRQTYDDHASYFDESFENYFQTSAKKEVDVFLGLFKGRTLLDLGSGAGNHAAYFVSRGLDVLCFDISPGMIAVCKRKGLKAVVGDMETMEFPDNSFDGVWAYTSLLHIPKRRAAAVVEKIYKILSPGGLAGFATIEGQKEEMRLKEEIGDAERFFAYYSDNEIRELFKGFTVLYSNKTTAKDRTFLNYIFKKS